MDWARIPRHRASGPRAAGADRILNLQANSPLGLKIGKLDYLSAPGHSVHSMDSEFFTEDSLAGASSGMRTSADASVHAHGPSLITTHASVIDLVLSMEKVSVRSTLA